MIKVILCDATQNDIQLSRELLHSCPSIHIVETVCGDTQLLNLLKKDIEADVILLDINLPFTNGLTLIKDLSLYHPSYKILVLSHADDMDIILRTITHGADGFLYKKDIVPCFLEEAITYIHTKGYYTSMLVTKEMFDDAKKQKPELPKKGIFSLTEKEEAVFKYLATGKTYKEIAQISGWNQRTVEWHTGNIFSKLGVSTRAGATEMGSFKSNNVHHLAQ